MNIQNFQNYANAVIASGSTPKAKEFAKSVISKIESKGSDWIAQNAKKLQIEVDFSTCNESAPVADNRIFYIQKWQLALI